MNGSFSSGLALGIFLASMLNLVLIGAVAKPLAREYGFYLGACTASCGSLVPRLENGQCFCEEPNKNRTFKEIPKYPE